jgi:homoserine kinase
MIEIEVPATSANLGPGFDCLGIALTLSNKIRVEIATEDRIEGCPSEWAGDNNLFLRSFRHGYELLQTSRSLALPHIAITMQSEIPPARGLGSSASLAVAGAAAALILAKGPSAADEQQLYHFLHSPENISFLVRAATDIEGHPDNAAPALYGGFTAAGFAGSKIIVSQSELAPKWEFAACVPDFELETTTARKALPESYSRSDVVHGLSHSALMALALRNADLAILHDACDDRIHEPYRQKLIPDFEVVTQSCRKVGSAAVWISGSGPTILGIFESSSLSESQFKFSELASEIAKRAQHTWRVLPLRADNLGIRARLVDPDKDSL